MFTPKARSELPQALKARRAPEPMSEPPKPRATVSDVQVKIEGARKRKESNVGISGSSRTSRNVLLIDCFGSL